ncbi:major facilitator superfamily domain-containing protein [Blyttiomyces helicus]|uniref:Major facilitator superfamily domain-containing protein n=1 Tax=Blyttiomyces helicus TaxID=388810 RepID=A0A4P9W969_9FUNG|nr:major facilitator superfamily domain-containing protein [Blyttiomyces helicus]|eukprot:RKO87648.1 major facilitator superfamily domain-containing protein [Blyttiomyces helicus]
MHAASKEFGQEQQMNWIATSYLLGFTVTQMLLGKLTDIFGRQTMFNSTLVVFFVGTLWCTLAQSMPSLIVARLLQGIGAAGRQTVGLIIVLDTTTPTTRGTWLGMFNMSLSLGLAIGPYIGALLSAHATWRWTYWVTLMLNVVMFAIAVLFMRFPPKQGVIMDKLRSVDYVGSIVVAAAAALLCISIELGGEQYAWGSPVIIVLPSSTSISSPSGTFPFAVIINFVAGAALFGSAFYLPKYLLNVKNASLEQSGIEMLALNVAAGFASVGGSHLISRTGKVRLVGLAGAALVCVGSAGMFASNQTTSASLALILSVIMGLGIGILYQLAMVVGPMSVKPDEIAGISGFLGFVRTLGGTFATALLTSIFTTVMKSDLEGVLPQDVLDTGLQLADNHALYPQKDSAIVAAMVKAFHIGYIPVIAISVLYAVAVAVLHKVDFVVKRPAAEKAAD